MGGDYFQALDSTEPFSYNKSGKNRRYLNQEEFAVEYRKLPHGEEKISILGLGTSSIGAAGEKEIEASAAMALENGINYFDLASADAEPFPVFGRAMAGCRDKVYFQVHFGAYYRGGKYGWTTDLDTIRRSVDWQFKALKTDYIDFGFLHCLDEEQDLAHAMKDGILDYLLQLKKEGIVRHMGLSSHTPAIVHRALDAGILDMVMFSINPAYDYRDESEYAAGSADERMSLYRRCEAEGACVYCNHCQPCPGGLDVGLINKYYDLARAGDVLARNHYANLEKKAGDCLHCGHCDARCPFHVRQGERMDVIRSYFGE